MFKFTRVGFVVNPASGKRNQKFWIKKIRPMFERKGFDIKVAFTGKVGDGIYMAREMVNEGYNLIVSVGGDGTLNEVVNGIAGSNSVLGIIPLGSGNVFAKENHIPLNPIEASRLIIEDGKVKKIDIGKADDRFFLMLLSCGFDAYSVYKTEVFHRDAKTAFGRLSFIFVGLRSLFKYKYHLIKVSFDDGKISDEGSMIVVSNTSYYGMPFIKINPDAVPVDGQLNVAVIKTKSWFDMVSFAFRVIAGGVLNRDLLPEEKVVRYTAKSLFIESKERVYTQTDGEVYKLLPVRVEIYHKFLPVILPDF